MICYRDRTFCEAEDCDKFRKCPIALTPQVKRAAEEWWGGKDAPIAKFKDAPNCYRRTIVPGSETRNDPDQGKPESQSRVQRLIEKNRKALDILKDR